MALSHRITKGILSVAAGVAILGIVFSPFINTAPSGSTMNTQNKSSPAFAEIYYNKCGHTEISYDTSISGLDDNNRAVIDNYCPQHFKVIAKNGKLNVYLLANLEGDPIRSEVININKLPQTDKISLEKGIEVYSDERLESLLEDYLS